MKSKKNLYKLIVVVILIVVIAFALVRCADEQENKEVLSQGSNNLEQSKGESPLQDNADKQNDSVISVEAKEVAQGTLATYVNIVGEARPYREVELVSKLSEIVDKVNIQVGDIVDKGDILVELNRDDQEITVKEKEGVLAATEADLQDALNGSRKEKILQCKADVESAKSDLEVAQNNYDRYKELYDQKYISKQTFEEYANKLTSSRSSYESKLQALKMAEDGSTVEEIKSLRAQVTQAEAGLSSAKLDLSRTSIKAPISGVISNLNIEIGEMTNTSSSILTISQLNKIKIKAYVSQRIVNKLKAGDSVVVYFSAIDDSFIAKIQSISPVADEIKKSFPVEIVVANPEQIIKAGMYAEIKLKTNQVADHLVVPQSAILEENGENYVYIVNNNKAKKLRVATGIASEDQIVILTGLQEGDQLIITGAEYLKDGSRINLVGQGDKQ
ncbi:efflux RND transporter periplasmic adaptor subunit [Iocasia frigidifontis]|uniref:efflux RND transporter periplasmic adaptor subunit n=1 Tax=Iocasia fonsfrigidae TaxID=2682810 RepID=UPI001E3E95B2|nr:efflux RND transporter periplasmic adaptor subunit [Iocasia fonsfrigidae]